MNAEPHNDWSQFVGEVRARLKHIEDGISHLRNDIERDLDRGRDRMNKLEDEVSNVQSNTDQIEQLWAKFQWVASELQKQPDREAQRRREHRALWVQVCIAAATVGSVLVALWVGRI